MALTNRTRLEYFKFIHVKSNAHDFPVKVSTEVSVAHYLDRSISSALNLSHTFPTCEALSGHYHFVHDFTPPALQRMIRRCSARCTLDRSQPAEMCATNLHSKTLVRVSQRLISAHQTYPVC